MVKIKEPRLVLRFENEKKKGQNLFDLPQRGLEPHIFSNFPAHNLNSIKGEGEEFKSRRGS